MASNGIGDLGQYDFMNKGMYPGSQIDRSYYATPTQAPLGAQAVMADYDPAINPLTGQPVSRFTEGGIARFAYGGTPEEQRALIADAYQKILGRAPGEGEDITQWASQLGETGDTIELANRLAQTEEGTAYGKSNPNEVYKGAAQLSQVSSPFKDTETPYSNMKYVASQTTPITEEGQGGITTHRFQDQNGGVITVDAGGQPINYEPGRGWYEEQLRKNPNALRSMDYRNQTYLATGPIDQTYKFNGVDVPISAAEYQVDPQTGKFITGKTGDFTPLRMKDPGYDMMADWGGPAAVIALPALAAAGVYAAPYLAAAGTTAAGTTAAGTGIAAGTAASTTPAWMVAAGKGAMTGAAMGGGSAALTGGDVVKGTLYGGVTGAVGGAAGSAMGGGYAGNMAGGALAGGTGSALRGGNIATGAGMGAVGGAINTGISGLDAPPEVKTGLNMFGKPLAMSTVAGAMGSRQSNQGTNYGDSTPYGINAGAGGQYVPFNSGIAPTPPIYNPTNPNPFAISGMTPNNLYYGYKPATFGYAQGGIAALGSYSDGGRLLKGPGDGMSDDIPASIGDAQPARLADGEFVIPADVVSHLGNGSTDAGAKHLYKMMEKIRHARTGNKKQGKQINPNKFLPKE